MASAAHTSIMSRELARQRTHEGLLHLGGEHHGRRLGASGERRGPHAQHVSSLFWLPSVGGDRRAQPAPRKSLSARAQTPRPAVRPELDRRAQPARARGSQSLGLCASRRTYVARSHGAFASAPGWASEGPAGSGESSSAKIGPGASSARDRSISRRSAGAAAGQRGAATIGADRR